MPPHQVQPPPPKTPDAQTSGDEPKADSTPAKADQQGTGRAKAKKPYVSPEDTSTPPPKSVSLVDTVPAPTRQNPPDMMAFLTTMMAQMQQMHQAQQQQDGTKP